MAKLAGVSRRALSRLVEAYADYEGGTKSEENRLKVLLREPFYMGLAGTNGATIFREEVCVALLEYYAYRSPVKNEKALYSYRKFAAMGWHNWVLSVCGCRLPSSP